MTYQEKMKWLGRYQAALSYQHMLRMRSRSCAVMPSV